MGTKNNPGLYDCYANAAPDEPMFVLLGRDVSAAGIVETWCATRRARLQSEGRLTPQEEAQIAEALACAQQMRGYAAGYRNGKAQGIRLPVNHDQLRIEHLVYRRIPVDPAGRPYIVITGPQGCGKTFKAKELAAGFKAQGKSVEIIEGVPSIVATQRHRARSRADVVIVTRVT